MKNLLKPLFFKGHTLHRFWRKVFYQKKYRYVKKWGGHTQLRKGLMWLHNLVFKLDCPGPCVLKSGGIDKKPRIK